MKTHYTLLELSQGWRYVGDDWELDSDNITCRNKLTSETTTFGADDTCPWCIELGVERTLPREAGVPTPYPIEGGVVTSLPFVHPRSLMIHVARGTLNMTMRKMTMKQSL